MQPLWYRRTQERNMQFTHLVCSVCSYVSVFFSYCSCNKLIFCLGTYLTIWYLLNSWDKLIYVSEDHHQINWGITWTSCIGKIHEDHHQTTHKQRFYDPQFPNALCDLFFAMCNYIFHLFNYILMVFHHGITSSLWFLKLGIVNGQHVKHVLEVFNFFNNWLINPFEQVDFVLHH